MRHAKRNDKPSVGLESSHKLLEVPPAPVGEALPDVLLLLLEIVVVQRLRFKDRMNIRTSRANAVWIAPVSINS